MSLRGRKNRRERGKDQGQRKDSKLPPALWEQLQQQPGETGADHKRRYAREVMRYWRGQNRERDRENRRDDQSTERFKAKKKEWLGNNLEKVRAQQKRYFDKNKPKRLRALKDWRASNPERARERMRAYQKAHPEVFASAAANARARAVQATPPWAWSLHCKEFERIYRKCARMTKITGIPHHVDHIYPLAGKTSCGLHVPWNLQVIPAAQNMRKYNSEPIGVHASI